MRIFIYHNLEAKEAMEKGKYIGNMRITVKYKFTTRSENVKNDHFNDSSLLSQLLSNHTIKVKLKTY